MSKIVLSFVVLCFVAVSYCEVQVSTKLAVVDDGSVLKAVLPPDDGTSNWGDRVYKQRQSEDLLLLRDLLIYPVTSTRDQTLRYSASFSNVKSITSVRAINIGRERAYAGDIDVYTDGIDLYLTLPAETDPRLLIEVYGFQS